MSHKSDGSIVKGFFWMFFLSILLVWIPVLGQFIAGIVGGKKAGGVGNAVVAYFLPAIVLTALFFWFFPLIPFIGLSFVIMLLSINFALFCGAIVGGALN